MLYIDIQHIALSKRMKVNATDKRQDFSNNPHKKQSKQSQKKPPKPFEQVLKETMLKGK